MCPKIMLMDNGSLRPQPTLRLRGIAHQLSVAADLEVNPVSILHSNRVDPSRLNDLRAEVAAQSIDAALAKGYRSFVCLPFFLGPSLALTEYLPMLFEERRARYPDLKYTIAAPLAGEDPAQPDARLIAALAERVRVLVRQAGWRQPAVALVDHGTPVRAVNTVREATAKALAAKLGDTVACVRGFAMERKPEAAYAFNEPLLESVRSVEGFAEGPIVVAMFFLLEGRHAGPQGDVAAICAEVLAQHPAAGPLRQTELLGVDDRLVPLLVERLQAALRLG